MTENPYYSTINGEPAISDAGFALIMGVPLDKFAAEVQRQQNAAGLSGRTFRFRVPAEWAKSGQRIRKEISAALGYEPGMADAIDYLASQTE